MTIIRDPHDKTPGARHLAQRWDETVPLPCVRPGLLIDWREPAPTLLQRLARAWRAAVHELVR